MVTKNPTHDAVVLSEIVQSLLSLIQKPVLLDHDDRRAYPRYEVNWSALLRYDDDPIWMPIFIRDISEKSVGYRHELPMKQGIATVSFFTEIERPSVQLRMRLLWCEPAECGMYFSGSEFVGIAHDVPSPW